jgi:hypothetical protein
MRGSRVALIAGAAACGSGANVPDAAIDAPLGVPDLQFIADEMVDSLQLDSGSFLAGDCEVVEGCVGGPGARRLLRFDTATANVGTADLIVGMPPPAEQSDERFEWSPCHKHHHFKDFIIFELVSSAGVVTTARKQSFCLQDDEQVDPRAVPRGYTCLNQGLSRGFADIYARALPCQWIDITEVPPGSYTLRVVANPEHALVESSYDNNVFTVGVEVP